MLTTILLFMLVSTTRYLTVFTSLALLSIIAVTPTLFKVADGSYLLYNSYISYDSVTVSVVLVSTLISLWLLVTYANQTSRISDEWVALLVLLLIGSLAITSSNSNLSLFVGVELQSLVLYILLATPINKHVGFAGLSQVSLSYLINAAIASTFLLYGIASSSTVLILVAVLWKIGLIPMHVWSLPILDNLHSIVTALYLTITKYGLLVAVGLLASVSSISVTLLAIVGLLNLTVGNILGLIQFRYQRIIVYSSLVQIGYMLLVASVSSSLALSYFEIYSFFTIILLILWTIPTYSLYNAAVNMPRVQLWTMIFALYSVAGLPYMPLFWTKLMVLLQISGSSLTIALLSTLLSSLIYVRLIKYMSFFKSSL